MATAEKHVIINAPPERIWNITKDPAKLAEGMVVKSFEQMADKTLSNVKAMAEA